MCRPKPPVLLSVQTKIQCPRPHPTRQVLSYWPTSLIYGTNTKWASYTIEPVYLNRTWKSFPRGEAFGERICWQWISTCPQQVFLSNDMVNSTSKQSQERSARKPSWSYLGELQRVLFWQVKIVYVKFLQRHCFERLNINCLVTFVTEPNKKERNCFEKEISLSHRQTFTKDSNDIWLPLSNDIVA